MAEYEAAHAQNQNEETEYAQQNQEQQNFGNQQQPPTEEDENLEEKDQLETQNKEHAEENQQSQSQEEAQNKDQAENSITLGSYDSYRQRIEEWSTQFKTQRESTQVTVAKLVQLIKNQGLTQNFKFNSLLVLSNVLIGTPTYSYIDRQMLRLHGNLDECYKYNLA
ncbi:hypothetical protein ACET3Z_000778 [Daucus carota]